MIEQINFIIKEKVGAVSSVLPTSRTRNAFIYICKIMTITKKCWTCILDVFIV